MTVWRPLLQSVQTFLALSFHCLHLKKFGGLLSCPTTRYLLSADSSAAENIASLVGKPCLGHRQILAPALQVFPHSAQDSELRGKKERKENCLIVLLRVPPYIHGCSFLPGQTPNIAMQATAVLVLFISAGRALEVLVQHSFWSTAELLPRVVGVFSMLLSLLQCRQAGIGGSEAGREERTKRLLRFSLIQSARIVFQVSCGRGYDGLRISVNNASQVQATHGAAFIHGSNAPVFSALAKHYGRLLVEPECLGRDLSWSLVAPWRACSFSAVGDFWLISVASLISLYTTDEDEENVAN